MPLQWARLLQNSNITRTEQQKNPQTLLKVSFRCKHLITHILIYNIAISRIFFVIDKINEA